MTSGGSRTESPVTGVARGGPATPAAQVRLHMPPGRRPALDVARQQLDRLCDCHRSISRAVSAPVHTFGKGLDTASL